MSKIISTSTGRNFLQKTATPADRSYINNVQLYEKHAGNINGSYTLSGSYIPDSNTLLVFVNGQKAEKVTTPTTALDYRETNLKTITFGDSHLTTDIIEFYVVGTLIFSEVDISNLVSTGSIPTGNFKNKIINGNFDIWQRNTTQTSSGYGSDDRWINANTGSTKVHSRQTFTLGQTEVPGNPKYFSRTVVTSVAGVSNGTYKLYKIEDVKQSSNKTLTLSFWAKADSNKNIAVEFYQNFGTGGTPSDAITGINVTTYALTTIWQKFTTTTTLPNVTGKTLGTDGIDRYGILIWFDAGSDYNSRTNSLGQQSGTFDIAQVQIEEGSIATPFEQRHIGTEIALCQRYYEKSYLLETVPGTVTNVGRNHLTLARAVTSGGFYCLGGTFLVSKRVDPTVTIYSTSTGASGYINTNTVGDAAISLTNISNSSFIIRYEASIADQAITSWQWTADAEL